MHNYAFSTSFIIIFTNYERHKYCTSRFFLKVNRKVGLRGRTLDTCTMAALAAAEAPDPKTFKSWEDAFHFPVPAVRRLEQQLRNDISSNRERLRTLVGFGASSSYILNLY